MNKNIKKIGKAVAGSALLVGATLTGAAGLASAASGTQDLGDYPTPFVSEDGQVQSTIVVGESAATIDVVGAVNIAGSLGNAAFSTETQTVDVSGAGGSWSASNGVTLDTSNDNLYYGQTIDEVRDTLTQNDLEVLSETTFTDDSNEDTDVTNYLNVGMQGITFGSNPEGIEDDEDPMLHVPVPSESDVDDESDGYLFNLQANFGEAINFTHEDVAGEDIELFGTTYTIAEDNENGELDELILYGSSETASVSSGEETTVTVDGEEQTMGVTAVTGPDVAAITVNGELDEYEEDETFTVNGQEVRVDNIIQTSDDQSAGTVVFSIGSQELVLQDGQPIQDEDGDDIEGSYVAFNGNPDQTSDVDDISSIDLYVGAEDDEEDYVAAGETFSHSALPGVEFHFGGLNSNAAEADSAAEVTVETNGDQEAQISFTSDEGDSVSMDFIHTEDNSDEDVDTDDNLADSDNDMIEVAEGAALQEDEYFVSDAGDFAHMWEVTSVDRDETSDIASGDEATIELTDVVTGNSVEVELEATEGNDDGLGDGNSNDDDDYYSGSEIIDGQTYSFILEGEQETTDSAAEFAVAYGEGAGDNLEGQDLGSVSANIDLGTTTSVYSAVDAANGAAVAFYKPVTSLSTGDNVELPSTQSTDAQTDSIASTLSDGVDVLRAGQITYTYGGPQDVSLDVDSDLYMTSTSASSDFTVLLADGTATEITVGTSSQQATGLSALEEGDKIVGVAADTFSGNDLEISTNGDNTAETTISSTDMEAAGGDTTLRVYNGQESLDVPAAVVMQPENDDDEENAFVLSPNSLDEDDGYYFTNAAARAYTGSEVSVEEMSGTDEDMDAGYNEYGTYVEQDTQDEGSVSLMIPAGQSTAGAAFTGADGSLSAEGGGASGSVETMSPTGFPNSAALDSDSNVESLKTSDELILVGGPAVNALTSELADEGKTMAGSEYTEGTAMLQYVNDAFTEGQDALVVAGYSGQDTREAANYLANYADNSEDLAGQSEVQLSTQQTQSAE